MTFANTLRQHAKNAKNPNRVIGFGREFANFAIREVAHEAVFARPTSRDLAIRGSKHIKIAAFKQQNGGLTEKIACQIKFGVNKFREFAHDFFVRDDSNIFERENYHG